MFNRLLQKWGKFGPFVGSAAVTTYYNIDKFQQKYLELYGNSKAGVNKYNIFFALGELFICKEDNYQSSNPQEHDIVRSFLGDITDESDSE